MTELYIPCISLWCRKCREQTKQALIEISRDQNSTTLTYECQECGETKQIHVVSVLPEMKIAVVQTAEA